MYIDAQTLTYCTCTCMDNDKSKTLPSMAGRETFHCHLRKLNAYIRPIPRVDGGGVPLREHCLYYHLDVDIGGPTWSAWTQPTSGLA